MPCGPSPPPRLFSNRESTKGSLGFRFHFASEDNLRTATAKEKPCTQVAISRDGPTDDEAAFFYYGFTLGAGQFLMCIAWAHTGYRLAWNRPKTSLLAC